MNDKLCSRCKQRKSVTEFGPEARRKGGLKPICRGCDRELHRLRYQSAKGREQIKDASRLHYEVRGKQRLQERRAAGLCQFCDERVIDGTTRCLAHAQKHRARQHVYTAKRKTEGMCSRCGKRRKRKRWQTCEACAAEQRAYATTHPSTRPPKEYANARRKVWYRKLKAEVIAHYGARCVCCGERNPGFLTIDHINGDGWKHRKAVFRRQTGTLYSWIKGHGFPNDLQILCFNCNCGRHHNGGTCPHVAASA